jgi:hypothetical protein
MDERVSRGLAMGDLDNDGRVDLVVNDLDGSPQLLRNEASGLGNWLLTRVEAVKANQVLEVREVPGP